MINTNDPEILFIRDRQETDKKADLKKAAEIALQANLIESIKGTTKAGYWEDVYFAQTEICKYL